MGLQCRSGRINPWTGSKIVQNKDFIGQGELSDELHTVQPQKHLFWPRIKVALDSMEKTWEKKRRAVVPVSMAVENEEEPASRLDPVRIRRTEEKAGLRRRFLLWLRRWLGVE